MALPSHTFRTDEGDVALKCPTEIAITDRREKELADQGLVRWFIAKALTKRRSSAFNPATSPSSTTAIPHGQCPHLGAVALHDATCRFAHYLKAMMRDKIGSFMSRDDCWRFPESVDQPVRHAGR